MGIAVSTPSTQKVGAQRWPWQGAACARGPEAGGRWGGARAVASCPPPWVTEGSAPRQPLVFGAMVHRDEAFETIFSQYMKIMAAAGGSDS